MMSAGVTHPANIMHGHAFRPANTGTDLD